MLTPDNIKVSIVTNNPDDSTTETPCKFEVGYTEGESGEGTCLGALVEYVDSTPIPSY